MILKREFSLTLDRFVETSRCFDLSLGKRFKEHTNLTIPTGVGDHCYATGRSVSLDNTKVLTREPQWTKRKVKEAK